MTDLLAVSSIHHDVLFDLNLAFSKDYMWYFDPRVSQEDWNTKTFSIVAGLPVGGFSCIKNLPI